MFNRYASKKIISTVTGSSRGMCLPNMKTIIDTKPTMGTFATAVVAGTASAIVAASALKATFWAVDKFKDNERDKMPTGEATEKPGKK